MLIAKDRPYSLKTHSLIKEIKLTKSSILLVMSVLILQKPSIIIQKDQE